MPHIHRLMVAQLDRADVIRHKRSWEHVQMHQHLMDAILQHVHPAHRPVAHGKSMQIILVHNAIQVHVLTL